MTMIGQPVDRTDGKAKTHGSARYAAEHPVPGMAHAVMVTSTIPSGRVAGIDAVDAGQVPGVLLIITHENVMRLPQETRAGKVSPPIGRVLSLLQDDAVHYNNQPVAVVVADTLEHAREAAARLRIGYERHDAVLDFEGAKGATHPPEKVLTEATDSRRGDYHAGLLSASATVDAVYTTPLENHNPLEPHATIASWDGDHLTLHDST